MAFESKRVAVLKILDELLRKHDSEYQYLFNLLNETVNSSGAGLKKLYPLPNVARKFMETFLSFKFPSEINFDRKFSRAKKEVNFEPEKIEKIKQFVNVHSHSNIDKMSGWNTSQWSEGKDVIKDCLELVRNLDTLHYEGLEKVFKIQMQAEERM